MTVLQFRWLLYFFYEWSFLRIILSFTLVSVYLSCLNLKAVEANEFCLLGLTSSNIHPVLLEEPSFRRIGEVRWKTIWAKSHLMMGLIGPSGHSVCPLNFSQSFYLSVSPRYYRSLSLILKIILCYYICLGLCQYILQYLIYHSSPLSSTSFNLLYVITLD